MTELKLKISKARIKNLQTDKMGYAARVTTNGRADKDDIAKFASRNTTIHPVELKASLELCMEIVAELLAQGYIVDLGPVGRLYPSCNSTWVEKEEDLTLDMVKPTLYFHPDTKLEAAVRGATLAWAKKGSEGETASVDDSTTPTTPSTGGGGSSEPGNGGGSSGGDNGDGME